MNQSSKFWNRIAERYSKRPIADEAAYQKKLRITREYFRPEMEVLEFGCGTGSTAITHAPYVKHIGLVAPIGRFLGLIPLVKVFTTKELKDDLTDAGFQIDYQWQPGKGKAVFIVAKKAE